MLPPIVVARMDRPFGFATARLMACSIAEQQNPEIPHAKHSGKTGINKKTAFHIRVD